jgi:hypothetical protein
MMADMGSGMTSDTSSYLKPSDVARDPLDQILKTNQVLGQGELAKGLQQAIQPDGSIDRSALAQVLQRTPAGALQAPEALSAVERLRQAGYAADAQGLQNFNTRLEHIGKAASYIIENPTKDGVMKGFGYLANPNNGAAKVGLGIPQIAAAQKEYYDAKGNLLPPDQVRSIAQRQATQAQTSQEALRIHLPGAENVDTGQRTVTAGTGTPMNPAIGRTVQHEIPPGTVQPGRNNQPEFRGTQPPSTGSDVQYPNVQQPDITKRIVGYPGQATSEGKPVKLAQPGDGTTYGVPRGGAVEPPPGYSAATEVTARKSAELAGDLQTANNEAPATKAIIGNLEKESKNFTQGPLADYKRIAKSFAIANLPIPQSLKEKGAAFDPESVADQESFNKNIYNLVQSQFKALGGTGTDSKLESASHTSPSELMSAVGTKNILSLLKGNQDAIQAKTKAWNDWQKAGNGPQTYPQFAESFNANFDPRVFQFKYMTPAERQDYYNKIDNPDERRELKRRIEFAIDNKMVKY